MDAVDALAAYRDALDQLPITNPTFELFSAVLPHLDRETRVRFYEDKANVGSYDIQAPSAYRQGAYRGCSWDTAHRRLRSIAYTRGSTGVVSRRLCSFRRECYDIEKTWRTQLWPENVKVALICLMQPGGHLQHVGFAVALPQGFEGYPAAGPAMQPGADVELAYAERHCKYVFCGRCGGGIVVPEYQCRVCGVSAIPEQRDSLVNMPQVSMAATTMALITKYRKVVFLTDAESQESKTQLATRALLTRLEICHRDYLITLDPLTRQAVQDRVMITDQIAPSLARPTTHTRGLAVGDRALRKESL